MFVEIVPIFISIPFFINFYTRLLDDIYARSMEKQWFHIIWVLGEPKHLVQPQCHSYKGMQAAVKIDEKLHVVWNSKGPVDLGFTP